METIIIDHQTYDADKLPIGAQAQLDKLRFVDAEIERLESQMTMLKAARANYAELLKEALRTAPPDGND